MGSIKQNRRVCYQKKRIQFHKRSVLLIVMVVLLLFGMAAVNGVSLRMKNMEYKQQEQELLAQLKEENIRTEEIKAFKERVGTQAYTEEIAKDKLGLAYPNEIIFKPQK